MHLVITFQQIQPNETQTASASEGLSQAFAPETEPQAACTGHKHEKYLR